jgi:beta-lactamase class A
MARFTTFVVILIAVLALFRAYTHFKAVAAPVPPGVYLGGLDLSDLKDKATIRQHLESRLYETLAVRFGPSELPLRPADVDFQVDVDQMVAEAGQYLQGSAFLDLAIRAALGLPQQRRDVPVRFTVNQAKLRTWLGGVAATYNHPPLGARLLPPKHPVEQSGALIEGLPAVEVTTTEEHEWVWLRGEVGYTLDLDASVARVVSAMTSTQNRVADLALIETAPALPNMGDLQQALDDYLATFPGFAAVYVHDLSHGDEANVDADVAFSGLGPLKIGIVAAVLQQTATLTPNLTTDAELAPLIKTTLVENENSAANALLGRLGKGDATAGAQQFTQFVQTLGLTNTYMLTPFAAPPQRPLPTTANQRTDWNTTPDPNIQTTPQDTGRLLSAIYTCLNGQGPLPALNARAFTPTTCRQILVAMTNNPLQDLIWAGLPNPQTQWIVHKHGISDEANSDLALIWGPSGPYVLAISLYRKNWLDWQTSNQTMQQVSRLVWQFFELQQKQEGRAPKQPPVLTELP